MWKFMAAWRQEDESGRKMKGELRKNAEKGAGNYRRGSERGGLKRTGKGGKNSLHDSVLRKKPCRLEKVARANPAF